VRQAGRLSLSLRHKLGLLAQSFTCARQLQLNGGVTNLERLLTAAFSAPSSESAHIARINRSKESNDA
jgi:hypothetical protein